MMYKLPVGSQKDVVDLLQRDERLERTILLVDDTALVDILLNTFVTPPR